MNLPRLIFVAVLLTCLFSCGSTEKKLSKYTYNFTYGEICGRAIKINGVSWRDDAGTVPLYDAIVPIGQAIVEFNVKDMSDKDATDVVKAMMKSEQEAIADIRSNKYPKLKQCIKSARYVADFHNDYSFVNSAQNWNKLADYLDKFSSYEEALKAN